MKKEGVKNLLPTSSLGLAEVARTSHVEQFKAAMLTYRAGASDGSTALLSTEPLQYPGTGAHNHGSRIFAK